MNVRKLRYLTRSYARTVPSKLALNTTFVPYRANATPVIGAECSLKVTKQNEDCIDHSLSFPSSPPVATVWPSGE